MTRWFFFLSAFLWMSPAFAEDTKPEAKPEVSRAAELAKKVRPSLVSIEPAGRDAEVAGVGTGFVISADGLIATNMHVIGEARGLKVELPDGKHLEVAGIHAWDREKDLAIIRVQATDLPALTLGDSSTLAQGDYVAAMGNPFGLRFSVVEGVVSAMQEVEGRKLVQLAMPIEQGNSGGPLLDKDGRVMGLVSMRSALTANLGFAVPVNELRTLMEHPAPVSMKNWQTIGRLNERIWKSSGGRWTQRAGVIRARERQEGAFGGRTLCVYQPEPPALPYEISVRVKLDDESGAAGLMFCSDGGDTHYGFYPSGGGLRLTKFEGPDVNSWTILEQVQSPAYRQGEWNLLRVRLEKETIQCFVNGEAVITSKDLALRTGRAGLCKFRQTEPDFKDFRVARDGGPGDPVADAVSLLMTAAARGEPLSKEARETLAAYPDTTRVIAEREAAVLEKRAGALRRQAAEASVNAIAKQLSELLAAKAPQDSDLTRAAFLISRLDNPEFDPAHGMAELDRMTVDLKASLNDDDKSSPEKTLKALHRWMFQENGFHGSYEDMNNRANSYLNEVIDDREGLPITLCLLHREFARRLGLDVTARGFPGRVMNHLAIPGDPPRDLYIDAFERGKILTTAETKSLLLNLNEELPGDDAWKPVSNTDIVLRMLNNLTANAVGARDDYRILRYMDVFLTIAPDSAHQRLQRLLMLAKTGQIEKARTDAGWLIEKKPSGIDTERVQALVESLK
jgi:regulator of sirC expression with transglutaminase-like and TPR domain